MHQITLDECFARQKGDESEDRHPKIKPAISLTDDTVEDRKEQSTMRDLMPIPRRKRKVRDRDRATCQLKRQCQASSRSADSRFKQKILGDKKAVPVMSLCSVSELVEELNKTNGNTEKLERVVTEAAKQMQKKHNDINVEVPYRTLMASVIQSQTFLERMKNDRQSLFTPEVWTFSMVHFNAYEEGVRYNDIFFRSCSENNCLSTYVRDEHSGSHRLSECLNADAVKKMLTWDKTAVKYARSFGRHRCILCTIQDVYSFCVNPINNHLVTAEMFATEFSFQFEGLKPEFELKCKFTTPSGVKLNYKCINIDAALDYLKWKLDESNKLYYIDFSILFT